VRRSTKYLILWILLLVPTAFSVLALVASLIYNVDSSTRSLFAAVWGVCIGLTGLPTALFVLLWLREHRRNVKLETIGAVLRAYGSIPLADVAKRLGKSEHEVEDLATAAITGGFAQGFIDHRSRAFHNTGFGILERPPAPDEALAAKPKIERLDPLRGAFDTIVPVPIGTARFCRSCGSRAYPIEGTERWRCWSCGHEQPTRD